MSDEQQKNASEIYEIKLRGHLDPKWFEWFYGMTITQRTRWRHYSVRPAR